MNITGIHKKVARDNNIWAGDVFAAYNTKGERSEVTVVEVLDDHEKYENVLAVRTLNLVVKDEDGDLDDRLSPEVAEEYGVTVDGALQGPFFAGVRPKGPRKNIVVYQILDLDIDTGEFVMRVLTNTAIKVQDCVLEDEDGELMKLEQEETEEESE